MPDFDKVIIRPDEGDNTEVYARVYKDGHIEIVGRNLKLSIGQAAYGRGSTPRWAFGDNWHVTAEPWETSVAGAGNGSPFIPAEGEE